MNGKLVVKGKGKKGKPSGGKGKGKAVAGPDGNAAGEELGDDPGIGK